ncbi:MAG: hypothetical protein KIT82_15755 [Bradyrhizobium sp.]|nr:hypothetical protein [Bradyrhizobium sp.]
MKLEFRIFLQDSVHPRNLSFAVTASRSAGPPGRRSFLFALSSNAAVPAIQLSDIPPRAMNRFELDRLINASKLTAASVLLEAAI